MFLETIISKTGGIPMNLCLPMQNDEERPFDPTEDKINNLLTELGLKQDDLTDRIVNVDEITDYTCDFCFKICHGDVYRYSRYKYSNSKDMCKVCKNNGMDNNLNIELYEIDETSKMLNLSYDYKIIALIKYEDDSYLYVVEESDLDSSYLDIHYYLKYYKNKKILIDYELQTYNPYFGCVITYLEMIDNVVKVTYVEKHHECKVYITYDENIFHDIYLKSKPKEFARCQNDNVKHHEIGKVLLFKKDDKIMSGYS
jgi:hypothetical protein